MSMAQFFKFRWWLENNILILFFNTLQPLGNGKAIANNIFF